VPDFCSGISGGIIGDWGLTPTEKPYYIVRLHVSKIKRHS
jgi:hypothetical protein